MVFTASPRAGTVSAGTGIIPAARSRHTQEQAMKLASRTAVLAFLALAMPLSFGAQHAEENKGEVMVTPGDLKWQDGPPSLPKGCKVAVLEGDPAKAGPFVMRAKLPDGYKIPAHT